MRLKKGGDDDTVDPSIMSDRNDGTHGASAYDRKDTISILDLIAIVLKRKWLIVCFTGIVGVLTLCLLIASKTLPPDSRFNPLPNLYTPTVKILLQDSSASSSLTSVLNQSGLGSLSGLIGLAGVSRLSNADLAQALLKNNTLLDGVAQQLRFAERYKITTNPRTAVRQMIMSSTKVDYDAKSGILQIGYQDIDKVFATEVANTLTDRLQSVFRGLTMDKVTTKREYLESAIATAEIDAQQKAQNLVDFQSKNGIYDLNVQSETNLSAVAMLQSQLRLKQIDLAVEREYYPDSDGRIIRLKNEIDQTQKQIDLLSAGGGSQRASGVPLNKMAQLGAQYLSLQNDAKIAAAILSTLKQQYETTKLEAMDTSQTFQIIEKAEVPELRSGPSRAKIAVIAVLAAVVASTLFAFVLEYFERAGSDPVESRKLALIRSLLSVRKKPARD
jgi:tyrosine-protein kinase Etk/Wzc